MLRQAQLLQVARRLDPVFAGSFKPRTVETHAEFVPYRQGRRRVREMVQNGAFWYNSTFPKTVGGFASKSKYKAQEQLPTRTFDYAKVAKLYGRKPKSFHAFPLDRGGDCYFSFINKGVHTLSRNAREVSPT